MVAAELAERLRLQNLLQSSFRMWQGHRVTGSCIIISEKESLEQLISRCDEALYKSKRNGRNQLTLGEGANKSP